MAGPREAGPRMAGPRDAGPATTFPQGVASADPRPEAVMLWTRAVPEDGAGEVSLVLEVSDTEDFARLRLRETLSASSDHDYTVRAYIDGLQPNHYYFYRFLGAGNAVSRTGRTRTAPAPDQEVEVRMAFVSCQNYEQAYFGAWARMLADDMAAPEQDRIQFILHLGDFIYERCWATRPDGSANSRRVPPFPDGVQEPDRRYAVSLADYRHLYKTYLSDPHLQAARARWPFICTWDDHEFSNDSYQGYSSYRSRPAADAARKLRANQAWFEFIPAVLDELEDQPARDFQPVSLDTSPEQANRQAIDSLCIYRRLRWGRSLDILLSDNRSYRSAPCLPEGFAEELGLPMNPARLVEIADAGRAYNGGKPPQFLPYGDGSVPNPGREREPGTCLGDTQRRWLEESLRNSSANWKLWGNSLPLIPLRVDLSAIPFSEYEDSILIIDSWAGYPHEQALLMQWLEQQQISGLVSFSGDHHMHGAGTVSASPSAENPQALAVDFSCAGLSSTPMYEELLVVAKEGYPAFQPLVYRDSARGRDPVWNMTLLEGVQAAFAYAKTGYRPLGRWLGPNSANPGLRYVDSAANGYGLGRFTADQLQVELCTVDDLRSDFSQPPPLRHRARFTLPLWQAGSAPRLQGPVFEGDAPFPFTTPKV